MSMSGNEQDEKREKVLTKKDLQAIRGAMRTAFIRSDWKRAFLEKNARLVYKERKDGSLYKRPNKYYDCANCGGEFSLQEIAVDHINPIGQFFDFNHLDGFINRLWCHFDNLQVLCETCHKEKTAYERSLIKGYNKL